MFVFPWLLLTQTSSENLQFSLPPPPNEKKLDHVTFFPLDHEISPRPLIPFWSVLSPPLFLGAVSSLEINKTLPESSEKMFNTKKRIDTDK
jgi:hypothetical protein